MQIPDFSLFSLLMTFSLFIEDIIEYWDFKVEFLVLGLFRLNGCGITHFTKFITFLISVVLQ